MRIVSRTRDLTTSYLRCCGSTRGVKSANEMMTSQSRSISAFAHSYSDPRAIKPASEDKSSVKQRNSRGSSRKSASVSGIPYDWRPVNIQARTGHVDKLLDKYVRLKYTCTKHFVRSEPVCDSSYKRYTRQFHHSADLAKSSSFLIFLNSVNCTYRASELTDIFEKMLRCYDFLIIELIIN